MLNSSFISRLFSERNPPDQTKTQSVEDVGDITVLSRATLTKADVNFTKYDKHSPSFRPAKMIKNFIRGEAFRITVSKPRVVAVGELRLNFYWINCDRKNKKRLHAAIDRYSRYESKLDNNEISLFAFRVQSETGKIVSKFKSTPKRFGDLVKVTKRNKLKILAKLIKKRKEITKCIHLKKTIQNKYQTLLSKSQDFTQIPFATYDDFAVTDAEDAFHAKKLNNGNTLIRIAITDTTFLNPFYNTASDMWVQRAIYSKNRIHWPFIAEGKDNLTSFQQAEERLAWIFSFEVGLSGGLDIKSFKIDRGKIKTRLHLSRSDDLSNSSSANSNPDFATVKESTVAFATAMTSHNKTTEQARKSLTELYDSSKGSLKIMESCVATAAEVVDLIIKQYASIRNIKLINKTPQKEPPYIYDLLSRLCPSKEISKEQLYNELSQLKANDQESLERYIVSTLLQTPIDSYSYSKPDQQKIPFKYRMLGGGINQEILQKALSGEEIKDSTYIDATYELENAQYSLANVVDELRRIKIAMDLVNRNKRIYCDDM